MHIHVFCFCFTFLGEIWSPSLVSVSLYLFSYCFLFFNASWRLFKREASNYFEIVEALAQEETEGGTGERKHPHIIVEYHADNI